MKYVIQSTAPRRQPFDLTRELNQQQRAVVEADPGELLVLAGAGTGKTRTLTYRVARLVAGGCPPDRILLCTFTNRAAREMVARVEGLLGVDMRRASAGTFHHIGNRVLRRFGPAVGLSPDFGILDPEDSRTLLGAVVAEFGLQALTARRFPQPKVLANLISLAVNTRRPLLKVVEEHGLRLLDQALMIDEVAARFAERKRQMNVCDFDDLLFHWLRLLEDPRHADVAAMLRAGYDHVLVDEYQDISAIQGALIDEMAREHRSLVCVGDDAQSIYSFRGADFGQIAEFRARHPDARLYPLTINYRSARPAVIPLRDVFQQAEFIAQRVLELHHEYDMPLSRMSVLYRNHSHSLELQVELTRRQIPFSVRSGLRFFEQAHIKDVVAYLRARQNPQDGLSWIRLLRLWPGVGAATAEQLAVHLSKESASGVATSKLLAEQASLAHGRARPALTRLAELWAILETPGLGSPGAMIREVVTRHYADYAERNFPNAAARKDDLEHLAGYAERYDSASEFLGELALVQGMSAENVLGADEPDDMLVLSTIHQAKGLEWPVCFVLWLAEGRFPMATSVKEQADLEEERRLFYVATTRAGDELYLCYPVIEETRDGPSHLMRPSRFLVEVDHNPAVFDRWQIEEAPAAG